MAFKGSSKKSNDNRCKNITCPAGNYDPIHPSDRLCRECSDYENECWETNPKTMAEAVSKERKREVLTRVAKQNEEKKNQKKNDKQKEYGGFLSDSSDSDEEEDDNQDNDHVIVAERAELAGADILPYQRTHPANTPGESAIGGPSNSTWPSMQSVRQALEATQGQVQVPRRIHDRGRSPATDAPGGLPRGFFSYEPPREQTNDVPNFTAEPSVAPHVARTDNPYQIHRSSQSETWLSALMPPPQSFNINPPVDPNILQAPLPAAQAGRYIPATGAQAVCSRGLPSGASRQQNEPSTTPARPPVSQSREAARSRNRRSNILSTGDSVVTSDASGSRVTSLHDLLDEQRKRDGEN